MINLVNHSCGAILDHMPARQNRAGDEVVSAQQHDQRIKRSNVSLRSTRHRQRSSLEHGGLPELSTVKMLTFQQSDHRADSKRWSEMYSKAQFQLQSQKAQEPIVQ